MYLLLLGLTLFNLFIACVSVLDQVLSQFLIFFLVFSFSWSSGSTVLLMLCQPHNRHHTCELSNILVFLKYIQLSFKVNN